MKTKRPSTVLMCRWALVFWGLFTFLYPARTQPADSLQPAVVFAGNGMPRAAQEDLFNRALAFYKAQQFDSAAIIFSACLEQDSSLKQALYLKALSLEKMGKTDSAMLALNRLYIIDKTYGDVEKRIKTHRFSVYLSRNWYYMIAMAVLLIIFLGIGISVATAKRG